MEELDYSQLTKLFERIDIPPETMRELKQRALTAAAPKMEALVRRNIAQRIHDAHGTVQSWQQARVGSKGGYAAVSPRSGQTGRNSPGAITSYLERGHKIRGPSGTAKIRYRPRIRTTFVRGRYFYKASEEQLPAYLREISDGLQREILKEMGLA